MPEKKIEEGKWPHPSRLPLGCGWSGHCTAPGHEQQIPPQDILEGSCNLGYASNCLWAPAQRRWDAVRFAVAAPAASKLEKPAPMSATRTLRLNYVCERDHLPVEHGALEYDVTQAAWLKQHGDARVQRMADCFLESYLKKRA